MIAIICSVPILVAAVVMFALRFLNKRRKARNIRARAHDRGEDPKDSTPTTSSGENDAHCQSNVLPASTPASTHALEDAVDGEDVNVMVAVNAQGAKSPFSADSFESTAAPPDFSTVTCYTWVLKAVQDDGTSSGDGSCNHAAEFVALDTLRGSFAAISGAVTSFRRSNNKASSRKLELDESHHQDYAEDRGAAIPQVTLPGRVRCATPRHERQAAELDARGRGQAIPHAIPVAPLPSQSTNSSHHAQRSCLSGGTGTGHVADKSMFSDNLHTPPKVRLEAEDVRSMPSIKRHMQTRVKVECISWPDEGSGRPHNVQKRHSPPGASRFIRRNHRNERLSASPSSSRLRDPPPSDQWWIERRLGSESRMTKLISEMRRSMKLTTTRL